MDLTYPIISVSSIFNREWLGTYKAVDDSYRVRFRDCYEKMVILTLKIDPETKIFDLY